MPQLESTYDVAVIGGGPGGSMASTLLSDFGMRVIQFEGAKFPRYHIGESLLSGTADLLKKIGVLDQMEENGFIKKYGVEWVWGENREPWTVYFKDALAMPYDFGYQVERGAFDQMLLNNARGHGVEVLEEHRVTDFEIHPDGTAQVSYQGPGEQAGNVTARWIVDASGQGGLVTKKLHNQQWDPYLKNTAIWSYWRGAARGAGIDSGNTFLPTFDQGWWWFIPLRDDITSIGVVVDRDSYLAQRDLGPEAYYRKCLAQTPELQDRLADAELTDKIHVQRDWSYTYDKFYGDGYIAVGDAACFIDPLFSTGVHLAMLSGFLAAVTVNTVLNKPELDKEQVLRFYESVYRQEFARLRAQVYFLYSGQAATASKDSYFWHARSHFEVPGLPPEKAFISLIAGAFEHRSWYSRFLQELNVPSDLRDTIEGIFDGKAAGLGTDLRAPLVKAPGSTIVDSFAVDGAFVSAARSLTHPEGGSLPLTDPVAKVLQQADGKNALDLSNLLTEQGLATVDQARNLVHQMVTLGFLQPAVQGENER
jgi:flavin-dependent dehydrogenase